MIRKAGVVFASVLLVVAAGTAGAVPADDARADAPDERGVEHGGNETGGNASSAVADQTRNARAVVVTVISVSQGGFVAFQGVFVVRGGQGPAQAGNETGNLTAGNETGDDVAGTVTGNASVVFGNQTSNGTAVVVDRVTLSAGGFVVVHDDSWFAGEAVDSVVGVSSYLEAGTHEDVAIRLFENVPGANFTREALNDTETLVAMPHLDTDGDRTFDFVATNGTTDTPYPGLADEPIENVGTVVVEEAADLDESGNETATGGTAGAVGT